MHILFLVMLTTRIAAFLNHETVIWLFKGGSLVINSRFGRGGQCFSYYN